MNLPISNDIQIYSKGGYSRWIISKNLYTFVNEIYLPPQLKTRARSFPVPRGMMPMGGRFSKKETQTLPDLKRKQ